jgi:hypothetical protein
MPKEPSDVKDPRPTIRSTEDTKKWEAAKAYLQSKDYDAAKKTLTELTGYKNSYTREAGKLLGKIKSEVQP